MKFAASLLLLATSVLGQLQARGDYGYGHGHGHGNSTTTLVTYTTVTVCPVTSTYTNAGSTYCVTELTTSTITVTECHGCVTTVQAPGYTSTEHEVEYVTKTTVCPVTETETVSGKEVTVVYTTTSVYVEVEHSTAYEQVTQPGKTNYETEVEYTTRTTVCPVTVTTTIEGKPTTYVYTTTSVIEEAVGTTEYAEVTKPGPTEYETEVEYTTRTTVCPVTVTTVVEGKPTTYVTTTTSVIEEAVHTTAYEVISHPGGTEYETEVQYATHTTLCPVTETTVIEGKETTIVYTVTSTIEEAVRTTVYEKVQQPDVTKTENEVAYVTETSLCPVTETLTISGKVVTNVYTSTQYLVTQIKTTINEYQTVYQTASNVEVYTYYSKVYLTVGGGTVIETIVPQTTVQITQTEIATKPVVTYTSVATPVSTPTEVITGAANVHRPAFALMAGLVGVLALL